MIEKNRLNGLIFSNYLRLPLIKYLYFVKELNETTGVSCRQFYPAFLSKPHQDKKIIGRINKSLKGPAFTYSLRELALSFRPASFNLDYHVNNKIRFVNIYNKLLYKILLYLIKRQTAYFNSGDIYDLAVLTQKETADNLEASGIWLHHIIKSKKILTPQGKVLSLHSLFFRKKKWLQLRVGKILSGEKNDAPYNDSAIQKQLLLGYGQRISIRGICNYRSSLFIPAWHKRKRCKDITSAISFSAEYLLTKEKFSKHVPSESGVYVFKKDNRYIYIGSSVNLKKRMKSHLYNGSKNKNLSRYIRSNKCTFQFALLNKSWKDIERHLYQDFIKTHQFPPLFNKMMP